MMLLKHGVATDTGNVRPQNEDAYVASERLFAVADGMGGHNAGEVASKMATDIISHEYFKQKNGSVEKALEHALRLASKTIYEKASSNSSFTGMGTTCTVVVVIDKSVIT